MADRNNDADLWTWLYHPKFPPDWSRGPLYPLATWINGMAFRKINFSATGRPVIKIAEIKNGITAQTKFTEAAYDESYFITEGDMLFSWSGQPETSIDVFWWRGPDGWLNQHIFKVLPNTDFCLPEFFYYLLRYLNPNFVAIARNKQTTGLGHVTKRDLKAIEIGCPPKPMQQALARILGALDDKIELNRRMNNALEEMAQTVFKSWFVDFDPVHAKADGEQPPDLAPHIAHLFPDAFEKSELGEIPKGWTVAGIYETAEVVYGAPFSSALFNEKGEGSPLIRNRDLKTHNPQTHTTEVNQPRATLVNPGDVLVGMDAEFRMERWQGPRSLLNQRVCLFQPKPGIGKTFLGYSIVPSLSFFERAKTGTTVIHLGKRDIDTFKIVLPDKKILKGFSDVADPIVQRIVLNSEQSRALATLRDTLLPKLISGELRIPDAERILERCL